ncbi:MAG: hypothetical protein ABI290_10510 [Ginsengibacter sp.]
MEQTLTAPEGAAQQRETFENDIKFPVVLRALAHLFSFVFHPLFIPVIAAWYLAYIQPGYFTGVDPKEKLLTVIRVGYNTIFYPALTILLLKALGFIKTIFLKTQRERIVPYIATNIFYFWMFLVFSHQPEVPSVLTGFVFGIFLTSSAALIANIYFKISMHALGVGSLCGLMLVIIFSGFTYAVFLLVMITFIITGLVCTSRMILSAHKPVDIYSGLIISILCQLIAYSIFG